MKVTITFPVVELHSDSIVRVLINSPYKPNKIQRYGFVSKDSTEVNNYKLT